jgi:restriction system protein
MPIPDFQTCMLPLLKAISDGVEHRYKETKQVLVKHFQLTEEELKVMLPSERAFLFDNRVGWANTYLKKAGLIKSERKGYLQITEEGLKLLKTNIEKIKVSDLKKYESFKSFHTIKGKQEEATEEESLDISLEKSPEEIIDSAFETIKNSLISELLQTVKSCTPLFFENLVVDLVIRMGYGGTRKEARKAIGKSGDGGIDGIINEDKLGLDSIYIQAKRWENTVPIKEVRDFAGSLLSKKARKGIFLTTSDFSKSAYEFVNSIEPKIILIDGEKLATLMIEYNVGIATKMGYEIKAIDHDYFDDE